jgi:hypothetical protein
VTWTASSRPETVSSNPAPELALDWPGAAAEPPRGAACPHSIGGAAADAGRHPGDLQLPRDRLRPRLGHGGSGFHRDGAHIAELGIRTRRRARARANALRRLQPGTSGTVGLGGPLAGSIQGVVSSLGLLYTTLARGADPIMVPNAVVLGSAVVPLEEPAAVELRARLPPGVTPADVEELLRESIETPIRGRPRITLEEIDGDEVVVRITATRRVVTDGCWRPPVGLDREALRPTTRPDGCPHGARTEVAVKVVLRPGSGCAPALAPSAEQTQGKQAEERRSAPEVLSIFTVESARVASRIVDAGVALGAARAAASLTLPAHSFALAGEAVAVAKDATLKHSRPAYSPLKAELR